MRYIDFKVQTGLFVATALLLVFLSGYGLLIGQFFIGTWQFLSSVISVIAYRDFRKMKAWHLGLSVIALASSYWLGNNYHGTNDAIIALAFFIPCWSLAIFYYVITWRWYYAASDRGKFLPNISF